MTKKFWMTHYRIIGVEKPKDSPNHVLVFNVQIPVVLPCQMYAPLTGEWTPIEWAEFLQPMAQALNSTLNVALVKAAS
jgi:hypothetical protein